MLDLSKKINTLDIDVNLRCLLESHLMNVQVLLGQCEKLIRTPIPLGYTRYVLVPAASALRDSRRLTPPLPLAGTRCGSCGCG